MRFWWASLGMESVELANLVGISSTAEAAIINPPGTTSLATKLYGEAFYSAILLSLPQKLRSQKQHFFK
eukprot:4460967-Amphidinium_carterae.1